VAQALDQAQQARLQEAAQALMVRVADAFFGVLTAADTLQTTRANEAAYGQQARQAAERYRQGLAAQVNVQQAQSYEASARAGTLGAERALRDAEDALAEVVGRRLQALKTLIAALPLQPPEPVEPAAWVGLAQQASPALAAQRLLLAAGENAVDAARAGHLPTLAAGLDVGRPTQREAGASTSATVSTVSLQLRIPLFAGGTTQSALRQALARRDLAADELEAARRRVERETLAQHRSAVSAIGEVQAGQQALDSARRAYEATRVGHELGTQTMTDLLLAIQTLGAAQQQLSAARHRFVLAQLKLRQAAGTLHEDDLAAVNALLQ
jgi:outer membrane protein